MDLTKAQHLLLKIQTFLEIGNGNQLSRLEKDLMKSYILQLYEAVSEEDLASGNASFNQMKTKAVEELYIPKPDAPRHITPEVTKVPVQNSEELKDATASITIQPEEVMITPPTQPVAPEPIIVEERMTVTKETTKVTPVVKSAEPKGDTSEALVKLFELSHPKEMDSRFTHVRIDDIASALGLNERIFTLNVLFGGDSALFENTCAELNRLNSFSEAAAILLGGPAQKYNWADRESLKMAEHFIRTVARKYPNP